MIRKQEVRNAQLRGQAHVRSAAQTEETTMTQEKLNTSVVLSPKMTAWIDGLLQGRGLCNVDG
jgi:hypothetical protein